MPKNVESTTPQVQESQGPEKVHGTREETRYMAPAVDIFEKEHGLVVVADLPGVDKEGIQIRVEDDVLTIAGRTAYRVPENPLRNEFYLVNFHRQFQLGSEVDQDKISAELKNGVLTLELPLAEKAKPKQIAVQVGG